MAPTHRVNQRIGHHRRRARGHSPAHQVNQEAQCYAAQGVQDAGSQDIRADNSKQRRQRVKVSRGIQGPKVVVWDVTLHDPCGVQESQALIVIVERHPDADKGRQGATHAAE